MLNNIFHSVPPSRGSVNFIWAQLYTVVDTVRCRRWAIPGFTGRRGRSAAGRRRAGSHRYRLDRPTLRPGGSATPGSSYGLRNEIAPWRSSAPQPLSFTPREQAVVDHGFLLSDNHSGRQKLLTFNSFPASALRLGLGMQMTRAGRPQVIFDLSPLWW